MARIGGLWVINGVNLEYPYWFLIVFSNKSNIIECEGISVCNIIALNWREERMEINRKFSIGLILIVSCIALGIVLLSVFDVYFAEAGLFNQSYLPINYHGDIGDSGYPLPTPPPTPHPYPSPTPTEKPILYQYIPILFDNIFDKFLDKWTAVHKYIQLAQPYYPGLIFASNLL